MEDELEAANLIAVLISLGRQLSNADVSQVLQHLLVLLRQLRNAQAFKFGTKNVKFQRKSMLLSVRGFSTPLSFTDSCTGRAQKLKTARINVQGRDQC